MARCLINVNLYTADNCINCSLESMGPGYYDPEYGQGIVIVKYSPKQLGQAASVDELVSMIEDGFLDEFWNSNKNEIGKIFDADDCELNGNCENRFFVDNIRDWIEDIEELDRIDIQSYVEQGDEVIDITYSYRIKEKKYVCIDNSNVCTIESCDWVADDLHFDDEDQLTEE